MNLRVVDFHSANTRHLSDKVINKDYLSKVLESMNLSQGKIFNKKQLNELIKQMKSSYVSRGYYSIEITKTVEIDVQNRVGIELDVSEGEVARIICPEVFLPYSSPASTGK